ncbi:hypothetical protein HZB00_02310 [Candidatus Woesearchaeota archaeon]|nr:hypothetical protein [Candidatus Woesearchaeota archaeon]
METEFVKMSPKGQLVVPQGIREGESFQPGDRFIAMPVKEGVLFKKVEMPNVRAEFEKLSKEIEKHVKKQKATSNDVAEAVKWARKR